jgi:hypothetical protein
MNPSYLCRHPENRTRDGTWVWSVSGAPIPQIQTALIVEVNLQLEVQICAHVMITDQLTFFGFSGPRTWYRLPPPIEKPVIPA